MRQHWLEWFPCLGSYPNFAKHCANLRWLKDRVQQRLFSTARSKLHTIDGVPMPICHYARATRCRSLSGSADFGYCAAKDERYYGMRSNVIMNEAGYIVAAHYTAANIGERESLEHAHGLIDGI